MDLWDANFMKNIEFWLGFNASKKVPGYFAIANYHISRHFCRCTLHFQKIYIYIYNYIYIYIYIYIYVYVYNR